MPSKQNHTCSVPGCHSPSGVSYHRYPIRDRNLHIKWLRLTARTATELTNNSRICQIHFKPDDFQQNTERRMLTRFAYPSLNLPEPLPDDVDLGLPDVMAVSEDSNQSMGSSFVSVATDEDSNQSNRRSVPSRRAKDRSSFQFKGDLESSSFLGEFDPGSSEREKRKLKKKPMMTGSSRAKPALYDDKGMLIHFQKDLCDCLEEECPGCHFPCPKCRSCKCGHECRQNRKWQYEVIEVDGFADLQKNNKFIVPK